MFICDHLEYVEAISQEVGVSCVEFNLIQQLDQLVTMSSVFEFLQLQWTLYALFILYAWSRYGIEKMKL